MASTGLSATRSKRRRPEDGSGTRSILEQKPGRGLYHCDYCHKDLSNALHIRCAVCQDFDLCLDCFSVGACITPHEADHAYRMVGNQSFPLYDPDWGADEEMLLMEGVELYGLGNWDAVSAHLGRPAAEARAHFFAVYVETDAFPRPKSAPGMEGVDIQALIAACSAAGAHSGRRIAGNLTGAESGAGDHSAGPRSGAGLKDQTAAPKGVPNGSATVDAATSGGAESRTQVAGVPAPPATPAPPADEKTGSPDLHAGADSTTAHQNGEAAGSEPVPEPHDHVAGGRVPHPTTEPAPDGTAPSGAEAEPASSAKAGAGGKDAAAGVAAAEAQQTGFNIKRNEFDPEWDHETECIISELEFKDDDTEDVVAKKLELIAVYNSRLDERERRRAFILDRGILNVKRQAAVDRRRSVTERAMAAPLRVFAQFLPQPQFETLVDGVLVEARLRARIAELQELRALGLRTFAQVDELEEGPDRPKRKADHAPPSQTARQRLNRVSLDESRLTALLGGGLGFAHAAAALRQRRLAVEEGRGTSGLAAWRGKRGALLDITALPDADSLLQSERLLCASERYLPAQYLAIKAAVLGGQAGNGGKAMSDADSLPFKVDPQRMQRLLEFFREQQWLAN